MPQMQNLTAEVKRLARQAGFARVGIASAGAVPHAERFADWLKRGWHADMAYLRRNVEKRFRPDKLVEGAQSVICLAVSYAPADETSGDAFVARYARGRDYHRLLKNRCRKLTDALRRHAPDFAGRAFVDSAPLAERSLAAAAGVGWIGRNGLLIVPGLGSYVLLCEIVCNLPLAPDQPMESQCGDCTACLRACPTGAIAENSLVDARRCISYLTIEHRGEIPESLREAIGRCVFGCDRCQEACPQNRDVPPGDAELTGRKRLNLADVFGWTQADFSAAMRGSAMRRAGADALLRNAIIAAGNTGDTAFIGPLQRLVARQVRWKELIGWAIARLGRTERV